MKKLFCVIGPSGSGKSTYVSYAKKAGDFGEIISTTTRPPRKGEVDGKDYHFVSQNEFQELEMIQRDEYAGHFYGTAQRDLETAYQKNSHAFMVVTYEGALMFKKLFEKRKLDIEVVTIFIYTPVEELQQRMLSRGDTIEHVQERIDNIQKRKEYENINKVDYVFHVDVHLSITENSQRFLKLVQDVISNC